MHAGEKGKYLLKNRRFHHEVYIHEKRNHSVKKGKRGLALLIGGVLVDGGSF